MIIRRRERSDSHYQNDYSYRLGWRYFGYHLVIAKTVFPVEALIAPIESSSNLSAYSWTSTENLSLIMSPNTLDVIDIYSGISNRLLLLVNEITELKKHRAFSSTPLHGARREEEGVLMEDIKCIHSSLVSLQQNIPSFINITAPGWVENIRKTAESTRLAALILLHETLRLTLFNNISTCAEKNLLQVLGSILDDNNISYIRLILSLVKEVVNEGPLSVSWPLWPLFIAGCCAKDEIDKISVIALFETALEKSSIGVSAIF